MKSLLIKISVIGGLILALLIPLAMVNSLIQERKERKEELMLEMSSTWGRSQILNGIYVSNSKTYYTPDSISITGDLEADIRQKGIFKIPFYTADLVIKGTFPAKALASKKATLNIEISDASAVEVKKFIWGDTHRAFHDTSQSTTELTVRLPENREKGRKNFSLHITVKGLDSLRFLPLARKNNISLTSNWDDPNFSGTLLPSEREITDKGFTALWDFTAQSVNPGNYTSSFGVNLFVPIDIYQQTDRSIKYGILFIALTFLTFFLFEILNALRIHPMQYLLVGLALIIFYLLLLSLSEHINFILSYLFASAATISLITLYCKKILNEQKHTIIMGALLTLLYTFLLTLLHLEEYSLLLGSGALFGILAAVMYLTRNIDWYAISYDTKKISRESAKGK